MVNCLQLLSVQPVTGSAEAILYVKGLHTSLRTIVVDSTNTYPLRLLRIGNPHSVATLRGALHY